LKIYVLHGNVAMQLEPGGIYNNHIIANCLKKDSENWSIIGKDIDRSKVPRFYGPRCRPTLINIHPLYFSGTMKINKMF